MIYTKQNNYCYTIEQEGSTAPIGSLVLATTGWTFYADDSMLDAEQMEQVLTKIKELNGEWI